MHTKIYLMMCLMLIINGLTFAQVTTVSADKDWSKQQAVLKNTIEADYIIRAGDVDNLGFGWPDDFDPFCGRMTNSHEFPWEPQAGDLPGFDRILMSSKFTGLREEYPCGAEGYSTADPSMQYKPVPWELPMDAMKGVQVENAWLQLFIDDFQSPTFCSKYSVNINGKRFVEAEKILNAVDQTGPVGKLVSIPFPEDWYPLFVNGGNLIIHIDETQAVGDGFAVDFVRLLVNRKRENTCKGDISGVVVDKETNAPIANATVFTSTHQLVETDANGEFTIRQVPTGFEIISASASGYIDGNAMADIGEGSNNEPITIYLEKGKTAQFDNKQIAVGESITLKNILFDQGKADLRPESKTELDKIVAFLKTNPTAEIELSGHTSSEGEYAMNKSLSYKRVKACKDYIVSKGISETRIIAVGYGPDKPAAPNDTEANRALNRRVEMRVTKL